MEQLQPDENLTSQLKELRYFLDAIKTGGEDVAYNRSLHIHSWVEKYIDGLELDSSDKVIVLNELFRFYDSERVLLDDWRDKIALAPLQLLVSYGYPSWDTVTPAHVEKCLAIASDNGSERHSSECFATGDYEGCFESTQCSAKTIRDRGLDLAAGLTALEIVATHKGDSETKERALMAVKVIGSMFEKGKIKTEEEFAEFLHDMHHDMSLALRPDSYTLRD